VERCNFTTVIVLDEGEETEVGLEIDFDVIHYRQSHPYGEGSATEYLCETENHEFSILGKQFSIAELYLKYGREQIDEAIERAEEDAL
jgi:hypothetical protein